LSEAADENGVVLAQLPAGSTQRRIALVLSLALLAAGAIVVPFGRVQLPSSNSLPFRGYLPGPASSVLACRPVFGLAFGD